MQKINDLGITNLDLLALSWFVVIWIGYIIFTRYRCDSKNTGLVAEMNRIRKEWAQEILKRENRIVDSQVINGLISKETFFASTTMLIIVVLSP